MGFFDMLQEVYAEFMEKIMGCGETVLDKEEKALFLAERVLTGTDYKPKWKRYLRDKRLKIHRVRSTI